MCNMVLTFLNVNYQTSIFPFLSQRKLNQILPLLLFLHQLLTFLSMSQLKKKTPTPPSA